MPAPTPKELQKELTFKTALLKVSKAVSETHNRQQLFKSVFEAIKIVFPYDHARLFLIDQEADIFWEILDEESLGPWSYKGHHPSSFVYTKQPDLFEVATQSTHMSNPQWKAVKNEGFQQLIAAPLRHNNKQFGLICFLSKQKDFFTKSDFSLFQAITDQIAIAVNNVLIQEQLLEEKQFKETLLSISEAIASIQNRQKLFKVIFERIKPIFPFDDLGLFVNDSTGEYQRDISIDDELVLTIQGMNEYPKGWLPRDQGITEFMEKGPMICSLATLIEKYPGHSHYPILQKQGLMQVIGGPLSAGAVPYGLLVFWSKQEDFYSEKNIPLFRAILEQLSVAVDNILANEQLQEEKQFKETLLGIGKAVARIQNRQQLFGVIFEHIKTVLPYDGFGVFVLDETEQFHYEIIDSEVEQSTVQANIEDFFGKNSLFHHQNTSVAWLMENGPTIISLNNLDATAPHPQHKYMKAGGTKQLIGGPLTKGDKKFGMLCFTSLKEDFYKESDLGLFNAFCEQLSVAVSNVLANEQLLEEKRKTEDLLAVTESIANITNGPELVKAIFEKLQKVFPFDEAGLFHLDWENETERDLIVDYVYEATEANKNIQDAAITGWLPMTNLSKKVSKEILVLPIDEFYKRFDHPHFEFTKKVPFTHIIAGPLIQGKQVIGLLYFWSKGKSFESKIALFKSITDQMSVALSNIVANEQLIEEKQFKETLLSVSEAIASIQDRQKLFKVIFERIKPIFPFDDLGLFVNDSTGEYQRDISIDDEFVLTIQGMNEYPKGWLPRDQGITEFMEKGPMICSLATLIEKYPGHSHYPILQKQGLMQVIGGPLSVGAVPYGLLVFWSKQEDFYSEKNIPLFRAILEQLSVAVDNILANEQLQEEKQFKETLLGIGKAVAKIQNRQQLLSVVFEYIKTVFPYDGFGVFVLDETRQFHFEIIQATKNKYIAAQKRIEEVFGKNALYRHQNTSVAWLMEQGPTIISLDNLDAKAPHPQHKYMKEEGIKQLIGGPLSSGDKKIGMLCFSTTKEDFYKESDLYLFRAISEQLSAAVSNVLANEEIQQRNLEQRIQITLTNELQKETSWEIRLKKFAEALEQIFPSDFTSFFFTEARLDDLGMGFEHIGAQEYRKITVRDFLAMTDVSLPTFLDIVKKDKVSLPLILELDQLEKEQALDPVRKGIYHKLKMRSILILPIYLGDEVFTIYLRSRKSGIYYEKHLALFQRIFPSFTLSLEKAMNFEALAQLNTLLKEEKAYLEEEVEQRYNFEEMIGESAVMQQVFEKVRVVMNTDTTVLILGETGTGKELVARALHSASSRKAKPLIKVNCATLPKELIESELFGHEKGAFTGAVNQRIGKFELAQEGTIFLDEIGELPLALQAKLLRVIQEKEFERLGGNKTIQVNPRIIAATNRDLEKEVAEGNFRSDLFFRLSVYPVKLPPLRDRGEDIEALTYYFLEKYNRKVGKRIHKISKAALQTLELYNWPGNVRELEHIIERSVLLTTGNALEVALEKPSKSLSKSTAFEFKTLQEAETELIFETLKRCKGKISGKNGAAALLGVPPTTLEYRMKRAGITREMVIGKKK